MAAKLATIGRLAASIAHELNNPLAAVSLRIKSCGQASRANPGHRRSRSSNGVDRMANLVANLLQFSRRVSQFPRWTWGSRQDPSLSLPPQRLCITVGAVAAERRRSGGPPAPRQLFLNLFTNASDAMPQGRTLKIRVFQKRRRLLSVINAERVLRQTCPKS
jgi:signal transduction histidine kinase